MSLPTIFDTCRPRADVLAGTIRDDEFMADLSRVVNGTAPADYLDPAAFFAKSYAEATTTSKGIVQIDPVGGLAVAAGVTSLAATGVLAGTYPKVTVDAKGRVTGGTTLVSGDLPAHTHVATT